MIHIFINALAASAGGGLTYVRNIVPLLSDRSDVRATVVLSGGLLEQLHDSKNVHFLTVKTPKSAAQRYWFEQSKLPFLIRQSGADVLLALGNFALWNSPVPQILLSRNALYTSKDFERDLRQRGDYQLWLDNVLKTAVAGISIRRADVAVAPSYAFAEELRAWTGAPVEAVYHGFNRGVFFADSKALPRDVEERIAAAERDLRLLFVSHYNYYRNFETLLRAIPILRGLVAPRNVRLFLTCQLKSENNPGSYRATGAAALVKQLGISDNVVELGFVPYRSLHQLYTKCDLYVTAAYAESFAHPLLEAMSSGRPIVASDIAVHREICGEAALYFDRFSPENAAETLASLAQSPEMMKRLGDAGRSRSGDFSWHDHLEKILAIATRLVARKKAGGTSSTLRV
jgi:glycosyltransferase involved in cell wall biosynthesis